MGTIPLDFVRRPEDEMHAISRQLLDQLCKRRSVRSFSTDPIPLGVVRHAIHAGAQAPSGANKQPWTFVLVTAPDIKQKIRAAAEKEERAFYEGRAPATWLEDLEPLGTGWEKPFLEQAPALIAVFSQSMAPDGSKHYYVKESVGLACGILIATLHLAGLATLTHTPSPMQFLCEILERPKNERPFLLLPVGYPAEDCEVPAIERRTLSQVLVEV
jgi:nitroreductase